MKVYVEVPPTTPLPHEPTRRVERGGRYPNNPKRPEGATPPSCPVISITHTVYSTPSEIAQDALIRLLELPDTDPKRKYDLTCIDFVKYLTDCEQKGFMIKGYDTKKGKMLNLPMSYDNRWGPVRRRILSQKLERLEFWFEMQQDRPVTLITLTSYQEGESISGAWHKLNKSRDLLIKLIRKYFGDVDYFWVPEPFKSGYVHYHLAVFAEVDNYTRDTTKHVGWVRCKERSNEDIWELMDGQGIEDKFRDLWEKKYKTGSHTYGLDFSPKKDESKIQHLKNYLSKYLEKGFLLNSWSAGMLLFNAHLWETGFRMYGASKRIRAMMNIEDDKPNPVVWLETRMQTIELTPENEEVEIDKVIWYRLYIPDWIDSPMWLGERGEILGTDPPAMYLYDWGRKAKGEIYNPPQDPAEARRQRNRDTGW